MDPNLVIGALEHLGLDPPDPTPPQNNPQHTNTKQPANLNALQGQAPHQVQQPQVQQPQVQQTQVQPQSRGRNWDVIRALLAEESAQAALNQQEDPENPTRKLQRSSRAVSTVAPKQDPKPSKEKPKTNLGLIKKLRMEAKQMDPADMRSMCLV
jgi:hypothetical protein